MTSDKAHNWQRDWLGWLLVLTAVYSAIVLVNLGTDVGRPFPGFFTYHNNTIGRLDMVRSAPSWWWGVTDEKPIVTDVIKEVEGVPFDELTQPLNERPVYEQAYQAGKKSVAITVERDGQLLQLHVPLVTFSWWSYLDFMFAPIVISVTLWLLAWLLFRAAPQQQGLRLAAALCLLMSVQPIGIHPSLFSYDQYLDRFLSIGNLSTTLAGVAMGVLFYRFAWAFPYPRYGRWARWGLWLVSGAAVVSTAAYILSRLAIFQNGFTAFNRRLDQFYFNSFIGLILFGLLAVTVRVILDSFIFANHKRHRREAQIIFMALLITLPTTLLISQYLFPTATSGALSRLQSLADSRFFALAIPFAFAAVQMRYHTFSGAERWFAVALLLAGSGLLANLSVALMFWQNFSLIRQMPLPPTIVLFLLFFGSSWLWFWQSSWRGWLGRVFQWERINYHMAHQVGQQLLVANSFTEAAVARLIADTLCQDLGVERTAVWLDLDNQLTLAAQAGEWPTPPAQMLLLPSDLTTTPTQSRAEQFLRPPHVTTVLPLTIAGNLSGMIGIGPRWDTAVFDERDLEALEIVGQQAALFLENARQNGRLRQADQQLLDALTHARQKTAQDLHDHLLPALSRLQLDMLTAVQLIQSHPDQARQTLTRAQQDLTAHNSLVRRIQQDLVARPLEFGLFPYLINLIKRFEQETGIRVRSQFPKNLDERIDDLSIREAIYSVWQQALDNVRQHAQATNLLITMQLGDRDGRFAISDNGQGSSPAQRQEALQEGRFGLRSMKLRMEAIGGWLEVVSQPGGGTVVSGGFPLPKMID